MVNRMTILTGWPGRALPRGIQAILCPVALPLLVTLPAALLVTLLVALLATPVASALNPHRAITAYGVSTWDGDNDLPSLHIEAILQTHDGYLWIGTDGGLARFDGVRFVVYSHANSALPSNAVASLFEDRQGVLWVGLSGGGLCQLQRNDFVCFGERDGLPKDSVRSIASDPSGNLWLAVVDAGLVEMRNGHFRVFNVADGLPSNNVTSLFIDRSGTVWAGTYDAGVIFYRDGAFHRVTEPALPSNLVWLIDQSPNGTVWLATFGGLCQMDATGTKAARVYTTKDGLPANNTTSVHVDAQGTLWAATQGGLSRLDGQRFTTLSAGNTLADASVTVIADDREGDLWLGTKSGMNRLRDQTFAVLDSHQGLREDAVRVALEDPTGSLWLGFTRQGLDRVQHAGSQAIVTSVDVGSCAPLALKQDHRGVLWIGCAGGTIVSYREGSLKRYPLSSPAKFVEVNAMEETADHRLFAATFGSGVAEFRSGAWTTHALLPGVDNITSLLSNQQGLWIASFPHGLFRLNNDHTITDLSSALAPAAASRISADQDGSVWLETDQGLAHVSRDTFQWVSLSDTPIFDQSLYNVIDDQHGFYWISTSRGIYRIPRQSLQARLHNQESSSAATTYPATMYLGADGVKSVNYQGFAQPTALLLQDGKIAFASSKGLLYVDPADPPLDDSAPSTLIEDVLADDSPLNAAPLSQSLQVPANRHRIEIRFTAMTLKHPESAQFWYRLDGIDSEWISAGSRRSVFYTDLSPGSYRFQARAANRNGKAVGPVADLFFHKQPLLYQNRWFQLLCGVTLLALLHFAFVWQMARVRRNAFQVQSAVAAEQRKAAEQRARELIEVNSQLRENLMRLSEGGDFQQTVEAVLSSALKQLNAAGGCIFTYDEAARTLQLTATAEPGMNAALSREELLACYANPFRANALPTLSSHPDSRETMLLDAREPEDQPLFREGAQAWHIHHNRPLVLGLPLNVASRLVGYMSITFSPDLRKENVSPEQRRIAQSLASLAAMAIETHRLAKRAKDAAIAEDRYRLAQELHDTLAGAFTGIFMQLQAASTLPDSQRAKRQACIGRAEDLARNGLRQVREFVHTLTISGEDRAHAVEVMRRLVSASTAGTGTEGSFTVTGKEQPLRIAVAHALLRILQEALGNAQRYARATSIRVTLHFAEEAVSLSIDDDGAGFAADELSGTSFGIPGMRARVERLLGDFSLQSKPGHGTNIQVTLPSPYEEIVK